MRLPAPGRREPVEDLHAGRDGDDHRRDHEEAQQRRGQPDREHVVRPDEQRVEPDRDGREDDRRVAEDRLAREDGEHLGDDPHHRQDHDVDLGVAEEPEDVLPEHGVAALVGLEEVRVSLPVEEEHRQPDREHRQDDDEQRGVDLDRPHEERDAHPRHPRRAQPVDGDDEVDRADERGHREDVERQDQEVDSVAADLLGQRRVDRPAGVRRAARGEEAREQDQAAEQEQPVRERVQPREGDVARADHQRHQEVPEPGEDRDDDEEDHRRPVQGHHLVVGIAREEVLVRLRELGAHQEGKHAAGAEEDEARDEVEDPDPLVVDGRDPARVAAAPPRDRVLRRARR